LVLGAIDFWGTDLGKKHRFVVEGVIERGETSGADNGRRFYGDERVAEVLLNPKPQRKSTAFRIFCFPFPRLCFIFVMPQKMKTPSF